MKLLLALGNPGDRYRDTRHNAGWWLADRLVDEWSLSPFQERHRASVVEARGSAYEVPVRVWKPLTYVNRSGRVLRELEESEGLVAADDLLVLVDDVWLEPGEFRLRARGSSGGHRGLASLEEELGSREYGRLRIGVGRPEDDRVDLAEWVLAPMSAADEEKVLGRFDRMVSAAACWVQSGIGEAMNRFN